LGGVLQLHAPSLLGLRGARAAPAGPYPVDAFLQRYPGLEAAAIAPRRHRTGPRAQRDLVAAAGLGPAARQPVGGPGLPAGGGRASIWSQGPASIRPPISLSKVQASPPSVAKARSGASRLWQPPSRAASNRSRLERSHAEARDWRDGRANMMGI